MQICSLLGAFFILWAFIASSYDKMDKNGLLYGILNAVGAALIAVTLWEPLNLGAFILETIWMLTGLVLIFRSLKASRKSIQ